MLPARVYGAGPSALAARAALDGVCDPRDLLVIAVPTGIADPEQALAEIVQTPMRLIAAMADAAPPASRDAGGELWAPAVVILLLNRAALRPGAASPAEVSATAALLAFMRDATLRLGPQVRLNALALDPAAPGELTRALCWLMRTDAIAGQLLGAAPTATEAVSPRDLVDSALDPTSALDLSTSGPPVTQR